MDIRPFLKLLATRGASDIFFSANSPPCIKVEGTTTHLDNTRLNSEQVKRLAYSLLTAAQIREFEETLEMDVGISIKESGRFRINIFRQRGEIALVARHIRSEIASIQQLNLPETLNSLIMAKRGLVLVVGSTGSGKSTTLAAMIDHRNRNKTGHILTIEDPVEVIHEHKQSMVNQREVGIDTLSYSSALKRAMREAPDVIMIGEIRDRETMQQAIAYADTGHLCISTLHAANAQQTLDRIINFFPDKSHRQILMDLSLNLRAIVSQRLVLDVNGRRVPAIEIMLNTPHIADLIQKGKTYKVSEAMEQSKNLGMQTFDQALFELYRSGRITDVEAISHAESQNNLSLKIRLANNAAENLGEHSGFTYDK